MKNCDCTPFMNDVERYARQVLIELPECAERTRRIRDGLSSQVCVDPCIVDEIKDLWVLGIETLSCCCGHNELRSHVVVIPEHIEKMTELGYKLYPHGDETRRDTFNLKTA